MTAILETYRPLFLVVTFALLIIAFYLTYRPGRNARGRNSKMMAVNKIMLWTVTVFSFILLFSPQTVTRFFVSGAETELTMNMHHTLIEIEGMT